ncbi:hypothetical protein Trco_000754 [Trichoderma cornu-damae]|uniref:E3-binding protein n=1 Tax=Trichoderma cornu-damae TaxID=654480 RepID=A0A9P8U0M3_9HYPO|nr:hypothetical protein Trco_000754 [Trichoderma cornu-damae]
MASLAAVCRVSARLTSGRAAAARGFATSPRCLAAQNFIMPALSPTMTEGNIASWKVKEGDSFSAGDVLLEIETDKATMDVEAQEDGIMMKIVSQDGSKGVQVGTRIAVVADAGDDISALELPPDEQAAQGTSQPAAPISQQEEPKSAGKPAKRPDAAAGSGTYDHSYPLLPSVGLLVHEHGISKEDVGKIKGTGPNGRLLKGDVLAFLGEINTNRPATLSSHFSKMAHLDLSNIKVAEKKASPAPKAPEAASGGSKAAPKPEKVLVELPISLENVAQLQRRLRDSADVSVSIATFISKATAFANSRLPVVPRPPTTNELFDEVVGLGKAKAARFSQGGYTPSIPDFSLAASRRTSTPKSDIIDILAGSAKKSGSLPARRPAPKLDARLAGDGIHTFSLLVSKEEKARAELFLERCKLALEEVPETLI